MTWLDDATIDGKTTALPTPDVEKWRTCEPLAENDRPIPIGLIALKKRKKNM
jgi:hypothetical protein